MWVRDLLILGIEVVVLLGSGGGGSANCIPCVPLEDHEVGCAIWTFHQTVQSCLFFHRYLYIIWEPNLGVSIGKDHCSPVYAQVVPWASLVQFQVFHGHPLVCHKNYTTDL